MVIALASCMPPSVWTKAGLTNDQINAVRSRCHQHAAELAGTNVDRKASLYDDCMANEGFTKVAQWQAR